VFFWGGFSRRHPPLWEFFWGVEGGGCFFHRGAVSRRPLGAFSPKGPLRGFPQKAGVSPLGKVAQMGGFWGGLRGWGFNLWERGVFPPPLSPRGRFMGIPSKNSPWVINIGRFRLKGWEDPIWYLERGWRRGVIFPKERGGIEVWSLFPGDYLGYRCAGVCRNSCNP